MSSFDCFLGSKDYEGWQTLCELYCTIWDEDMSVSECRFCNVSFTKARKHHCRFCLISLSESNLSFFLPIDLFFFLSVYVWCCCFVLPYILICCVVVICLYCTTRELDNAEESTATTGKLTYVNIHHTLHVACYIMYVLMK